MASQALRIGIDLGGTKIEALALGAAGRELARHRIATHRDDYEGTIAAMASLVRNIESETAGSGSVGVGIPGCISARTGLVKNANSTWLNGRPLQADLSSALGREVRIANDANCLAASEAADGAGAGKRVVFAAILGTGCGGGIAFNGEIHAGANGLAGEWGHNPLPWARPEELPGPLCYCGKRGCVETWISGTGLARDFRETTGREQTAEAIFALCEAGDAGAIAAAQRFEDRLARGFAHVIHILDPDMIVVGGGLSNAQSIYRAVPSLLAKYVFGGEADTPIVPAMHGDSSGVRGAAWLWPV